MTLRLSAAIANAMCDTLVDTAEIGAGAAALLQVFSGAQPAGPDTAVTTQTKLIEFALPAPAFGDAASVSAGGTATANAVAEVTALASGDATWFRITDKDGTAFVDGTVTDQSGAGDLKLSATAVLQDIEVSVVSLTITMPKA